METPTLENPAPIGNCSFIDIKGAKTILNEGGLPKRLGNLLLKCVEPIPDRRPEGLAPLLKELERWAKG